jgi:cysteine desulfurase
MKKSMKRRIYLDYASITPLDKKVASLMAAYERKGFGNPSAIHEEGVHAKQALEEARRSCAEAIYAHPDEIVFTSGGTEGNVLALMGAAGAVEPAHIIVSSIEHSSVLESVRALEVRGWRVSYIGVDAQGLLDVKAFKEAIMPDTVLVSVQLVNNETGAIQPIREIAKIIRQARTAHDSVYPLFHVDACQAPLYRALDMRSLGADIVTLDGQKMYGPRGSGLIWVRRTVLLEKRIRPILEGGGQERGLRSGTEPVGNAIGLAEALRQANAMRDREVERLASLQHQLIDGIIRSAESAHTAFFINTPVDERLASPHIVNVSFPTIDTEFLTLVLDAAGIACSTKSSCLRDEDESYVVRELAKGQGQSPEDASERARHSLRFSFGRQTKKADITVLLKVLAKAIAQK